MKRYLIISLLVWTACNSNTANQPGDNRLPTSLINNPRTANGIDTVAADRKPVLVFKDTSYNFGTIHQDEVVQHEFAFTNTGKTPLLISSAAGSCGCTVPDWPRDPIAPGQSGVIKVTFNSAGKTGHQVKSVSLQTNTLRNVQVLYIQADIALQK